MELNAMDAAKKVMEGPDWPVDMPAAMATWGRYYFRQGDYHKGATFYNQASKRAADPEERDILEHCKRFEMGRYHLRIGEYRKALNQLRQVLKLSEETFTKVRARSLIRDIEETLANPPHSI